MGKLSQLLIDRARKAREVSWADKVGHSRGDIAERRRRSSDESYVSMHAMSADAIGAKKFAGLTPSFRRNEKDCRPGKSVTALLLGDPWPERPTTPEEIEAYNERVASGEFTPPVCGIVLFSDRGEDRTLARIHAEAAVGRDQERASPGQGPMRKRKKRRDVLQPEG